MKKTMVLIALLCSMVVLPAWSQNNDASKADLFVGYSYVRADTNSSADINLNGFAVALSGTWKHVGLTGEFTGQYTDTDVRLHNFLIGPRIGFWRKGRLSPFAHALFGVTHGRASSGDTDTNFGMALGGGVDLKLHRRIALRLGEADYFYTHLAPGIISLDDNQNNFRFQTGVVFRFGGGQ